MEYPEPGIEERKILDAISTLKRVTGTPNSKAKRDIVSNTDGLALVYTTDYDSAVIVLNLLSKSAIKASGHTEKFLRDPKRMIRHICDVDQSMISCEGKDCYKIIFYFHPSWKSRLADAIGHTVRTLIAPDEPRRGRGR